MKLTQLAAIAFAALLVTAGAAAATAAGQANADEHEQASDQRPDAAHDRQGVASADGGEAATVRAQGPPEDLPSQVPDHVTKIHDLIRQFLSGDLDGSLGESVSDVTPGDDSESSADASG